MPVRSWSVVIEAPAGRMFACVDDIRNLAEHMSERRSMAMMGATLTLEIITPEPTEIGATSRCRGHVFGLTIDFTATVTRYVPGREKVWHTIGQPKLLMIDSYETRIAFEPIMNATSRLTIDFDYELPRSAGRLGRLPAGSYALWCVQSMIDGKLKDLQRGAP